MTSLKCILLLLFFTTNLVIRVRCRIEQVEKTYRINRLLVHPLIKKLVEEVEWSGLEEEGLYSLSGSTHKMDMLAKDCQILNKDISQYDVNVITSYLKTILRSLRPSLIDETTFNQLLDALKIDNLEESENKMMNVIMKLQQDIRDTLAYLMEHLQKVAKLWEINKMSPKNIGIIFGPTLMNFRFHDAKTELALNDQKTKVIEELLNLPSSFWKMLTNYESEESDSDFSNSEEDEEDAWGAPASADSSTLDHHQIKAVKLKPISEVPKVKLMPISSSEFQAVKLRPISQKSRPVLESKSEDSLLDELSRKLSQRASRQRDRITDSNEENN